MSEREEWTWEAWYERRRAARAFARVLYERFWAPEDGGPDYLRPKDDPIEPTASSDAPERKPRTR